jgi:hypothetical protein
MCFGYVGKDTVSGVLMFSVVHPMSFFSNYARW